MKKRGTRAPAQQFIKNILPSQKRSQAFLITAVIFIAIASAIITIHNYSKKTEFSTFPYIAEEIQIESEKVMDYALIKDNWDKIDDFTKNVSDYVTLEDIYTRIKLDLEEDVTDDEIKKLIKIQKN